ncbi:hypothetical protein IFO70_25755 [Phormidium tenue FACHB-886]|nr:hypothetical protein [Phormidium tenue FACHB-886]
MDTVLNRAKELKQDLSDFVLDAEDDLAVSLESFSAAQLAKTPHHDMQRRSLVIDRFIAEGEVGDQTPIDCFIAEHPELSPSDRQLLVGWKRSFVGLFSIVEVLADGFKLMNWTTAKQYVVRQPGPKELEKMARLGVGEILLTQIAPLSENEWMFFSPWTSLGKLGKPKLAVAIGNFKDNYKKHLYSDAPDLLEEAWRSVEKHHQTFVEFFGSEEVTLPGYQLSKKLAEFQEVTTKKSLEASGIDSSKSLEELAEEAGVSQEEIAEAAQAMGADEKTVAQLLQNKDKTKMIAPTIELPPHLKKAEQVTVLTHPRWGQMFLPTYTQLKSLLEADGEMPSNAKEIILRHLKDANINSFVWYRLAEQYPTPLQSLLREALDRPAFNLQTDLDALLQEFDKPIDTELPEIASVPLHLHNLFQEALLEVNKDKSKPKAKKKAASGFQR